MFFTTGNIYYNMQQLYYKMCQMKQIGKCIKKVNFIAVYTKNNIFTKTITIWQLKC